MADTEVSRIYVPAIFVVKKFEFLKVWAGRDTFIKPKHLIDSIGDE